MIEIFNTSQIIGNATTSFGIKGVRKKITIIVIAPEKICSIDNKKYEYCGQLSCKRITPISYSNSSESMYKKNSSHEKSIWSRQTGKSDENRYQNNLITQIKIKRGNN